MYVVGLFIVSLIAVYAVVVAVGFFRITLRHTFRLTLFIIYLILKIKNSSLQYILSGGKSRNFGSAKKLKMNKIVHSCWKYSERSLFDLLY